MYSFTNLEPVGTDTVCCSMSSCNYCFLTCILISQKAGQVVWYSLLFQNFPQFTVTHTVKSFGIVNKAEIDIFLELSCFFYDPADVGNLNLVLIFLQETLIPVSDSSSSAFCMMYSEYKLDKQRDNIGLDVLLSQFWTSLLFHFRF